MDSFFGFYPTLWYTFISFLLNSHQFSSYGEKIPCLCLPLSTILHPKLYFFTLLYFFFIPYSWRDNSSWYVFYDAYFPNFWAKRINIKWNRVFAVSCKLMELLINNRKCVCLKLEIRLEDSYFYATYFSLDSAGSKFSVISKLKYTSVSLSMFY